MRKFLSLVLIMVMLAMAGTAIAQDSRITFHPLASSGSSLNPVEVYTFYDVKFLNLCYVTQNSIFCIPAPQLSGQAKSEISKIVKQSLKPGQGLNRSEANIIQIY